VAARADLPADTLVVPADRNSPAQLADRVLAAL